MTTALDSSTTIDVRLLSESAFSGIPLEVLDGYAATARVNLETANLHANEFARFLALCVAFPDASFGIYGQIDNFWLEFYTYEVDYALWCEKHFGSSILRMPTSPDEQALIDAGYRPADFRNFLECYANVFGTIAPSWSLPNPRRHR